MQSLILDVLVRTQQEQQQQNQQQQPQQLEPCQPDTSPSRQLSRSPSPHLTDFTAYVPSPSSMFSSKNYEPCPSPFCSVNLSPKFGASLSPPSSGAPSPNDGQPKGGAPVTPTKEYSDRSQKSPIDEGYNSTQTTPKDRLTPNDDSRSSGSRTPNDDNSDAGSDNNFPLDFRYGKCAKLKNIV